MTLRDKIRLKEKSILNSRPTCDVFRVVAKSKWKWVLRKETLQRANFSEGRGETILRSGSASNLLLHTSSLPFSLPASLCHEARRERLSYSLLLLRVVLAEGKLSSTSVFSEL